MDIEALVAGVGKWTERMQRMEAAEKIVRDLADLREPLDDERDDCVLCGGSGWAPPRCTVCGKLVLVTWSKITHKDGLSSDHAAVYSSQRSPHAPECPWQRAQDWVKGEGNAPSANPR